MIDRLAYWYYHPREWLKKVALMDDVYLLNSPFTFQSMEKHAAYCAMARLGLKVPHTVLVPFKNPPDNARYAYTAARYNRPFDLEAIAEEIGYPLFMKPYDGGQWIGVTRIKNAAELHRAYDESGQRLMHLQESIEGYDAFARSLSIGPETMVMRFRPELPMHDRYAVQHDFLAPEVGDEVVTISRLVNAFFRWEFNSCENLVRGADVHPIDYANASPDVAITSLHYYFFWAMKTLVKWCAFCVVTGREPRLDLDTRRYFEVADRTDLSYQEKLAAYRRLADEYFETERYHDFCASRLGHLDELVLEWAASPELDRLLVHRARDLPRARAGALPRPFPRAHRPVGARAGGDAGDELEALAHQEVGVPGGVVGHLARDLEAVPAVEVRRLEAVGGEGELPAAALVRLGLDRGEQVSRCRARDPPRAPTAPPPSRSPPTSSRAPPPPTRPARRRRPRTTRGRRGSPWRRS